MQTKHFTKIYKKFDARLSLDKYCLSCGTMDATTTHREHTDEHMCDECDYNWKNGVVSHRDEQYAKYENLFL